MSPTFAVCAVLAVCVVIAAAWFVQEVSRTAVVVMAALREVFSGEVHSCVPHAGGGLSSSTADAADDDGRVV